MKKDNHPAVLLGASRWYPLSVRLAMAFIRHGVSVAAICPRGHPLRLVRGIQALYRYRCLDSLASLKSAIESARPDFVVPCDDGVVLQLHALHAQEPALRPLIERSLGQADGYPIIDSRYQLLCLAGELGIRIPPMRAVNSEADLTYGRETDVVLKTDGSMGGEGIAIAHSQAEAAAAYLRLSKPFTAEVALKRLLINHSPLALWMWQRHEKPRIILQQFIPGRPANTMIACWRGEMLASVTVEVLNSQGATGAATVVRLIRHEEIEEAARRLTQRLMLTGFYGLDFILEPSQGQRGAAYLIELNPRCTQLGHLCLQRQGDLAGIFSARLQDSAPGPTENDIDDPIESDTIAFFPQALLWDPQSPYLHSAYHDVPWESPELVRELLLEEWPYRQRAARIYHRYRPPAVQKAVQFETVENLSLREEKQDTLSGVP